MQKKKSIVIVGGGLAGLSAAYYLSKNKKYKITLLEGSDRLGGRVYSIPVGDKQIEMGGFMVFPWYKYFKSLLEELDLSKDLREYSSYTEYYQTGDGKDYIKDTEMPIWKVFPWKMLPHLIKPFFTNKLDFYEPDLKLMHNLTAEEAFDAEMGAESKAAYFTNELALSYTYAGLKDIPVSLYLGFGYKLLAHHGFDRCKSLIGGTQRVAEAIASAIKESDGTIKMGCRVTDIHDHTVRTLTTSLHADKIVLAHGVHDPLVGTVLDNTSVTRTAWYTNHYAVALKLKEPPTIKGNRDWIVTYNRPKSGIEPQIASIGNLSALNVENKAIILYVRIHPEDPNTYTKKDIEFIVTKELRTYLNNATIDRFLAIHHWEHTMPVVDTQLVGLIRENQGKNGIYFAGDYLGSPCMETAVYSGKHVADLILKTS